MRHVPLVPFLVLLAVAAAVAGPPDEDAPRSIADAVVGLRTLDGVVRVHVDDDGGRVLLELPPAGGDGIHAEFLHAEGLTAGLGSNPVGLDRSQLGATRHVVFRRMGGRVALEQRNTRFRALTEAADERRAVEESFASSILWAAAPLARDADGRVLVDWTSFLTGDAHDVVATLARTGQGSFRLDADRSAVLTREVLVFPRNLEIEARLTYVGDDPGGEVRSVAPEPTAVTLTQHHSLIALPEPGYRPREAHPRAGHFAIEFADYAAPLDAPLERRWAVRHRLEVVGRGERGFRVRAPIVYHLDRGTPEPIRGALLDGARWWAEAFEAAGYEDAFEVRMLPEGVHPLDARYNVIQWVHRATRGWSYGSGIVDPRTGERIKGHVLLGSLRVRHDRAMFEALLGRGRLGSGEADDPVELSLARLRQLSAHEVGHTLGLSHNFAASTYGGRASVMDYPAPRLTVAADGAIDASDAYGVGIGAWDRFAIDATYRHFEDPDAEEGALRAMRARADRDGLLFLSDDDARATGSAHPLANLWDNGDDPVAALRSTLAVRRAALARFGTDRIAPDAALGELEDRFGLVWFHHRFQVAAAVRSLGGATYRHASARTGGRVEPVDAATQRAALEALLDAVRPEALAIPEAVVRVLHPTAHLAAPSRERMRGRAGPLFDPLAAAATAADLVFEPILHPARCQRLVDQHRRDPRLPGLEEVLERTVRAAFDDAAPGAVADEVRVALVGRLAALARDPAASPAVVARVEGTLAALASRLAKAKGPVDAYLVRAIERHLERDPSGVALEAPPPPPGSPIGDEALGCASGQALGLDDPRP